MLIARATTVLGALALSACAGPRREQNEAEAAELMTLANEAARWIHAQPATDDDSLYAGSPGVVLFELVLYEATGEEEPLERALAGARRLASRLDAFEDPGLYTGLAGVGATLLEVERVTHDAELRSAVQRCAELLCERAHEVGRGVEWSSTTDVIAGSAGIGLFLLDAADALGDERARATAARAGERLIELATPEAGGLSWAMEPSFPRRMPNFSHGTAGIAYFLARLHEETGRTEFLDAALGGARYLIAVADTEGGVCRVFHDEPDGKELYYLGWCHGPVGTARLFRVLQRITGDASFGEWLRRSALAIETSGIPEHETPGFWNNDGPCCGLAGVAEFFLDLYELEGRRSDLEFSRRVTRELVERAARDDAGARWLQAEHRIRPTELAAQTGWMQGASGIGAWLVRLASQEAGREVRIALPDTPF